MTAVIPRSAWAPAIALHAPAPLARLNQPRLLCIARSPADPVLAAFLSGAVEGTRLVIAPAGPVADLAGAGYLAAPGEDALAEACQEADVVIASAADDILFALRCGAPVASLPGGAALAILGPNGRGPASDLPMTIGAVDEDLAVAVGRALRCDRFGVAVQGSRLAGQFAGQFTGQLAASDQSPLASRQAA